ncbi:MAG: biotin/lipoyl-containing protein [Gemmatimonadales bacterium]
MKYIVEIAGKRIEVSVEGDQVSVDGAPARSARLSEIEGTPVRLVTIGDAVHRATARRAGPRGTFVLRIDGRRYAVEALDERTRAIRDLSGVSASKAGPQPVRAPMPGLMVRIDVKAGDQVQAGQGVAAMEAMKMENELRAPAAGRVKAVHASLGQAVEKGALLVEFESE